MNWLRARIQGRNRRPENTDHEQAQRRHQADGPRPRLMLLVHDAAGPGSYRLHVFEDAASAEAFVQLWFPSRFDHGILAFWAALEEPVWRADPDEGAPPEAVILIRDEVRSGVVYPFSLSNMSMAQSWIAKEAARGLKLRQVLLYWATPVRISTDHWGRVRVTPRERPSLRRPVLLRSSTVIVRKDETARPETDVWPERADRRRRPPTKTDDVADIAPVEEAGGGADGAGAAEVSNIMDEVDRLVRRRQRRWMQKEGPFRGFGSPRGKF